MILALKFFYTINYSLVWACGKNGWVLFGQKCVDGGSKRRARTRETEVRSDGWCEGCLGQQRNDYGDCASMRERSEIVERSGNSGEPGHICNWMSFTQPFWLGPVFFRTTLRVLVVITCRGVGCCTTWRRVLCSCTFSWCGWDKLQKRRNYWISRRRCQIYWLRGACWWLCVWYLTGHDYPSLVVGESHGMLLLL